MNYIKIALKFSGLRPYYYTRLSGCHNRQFYLTYLATYAMTTSIFSCHEVVIKMS